MSRTVIGIDPSLTRTAVAWFDEDGMTVRCLPTKGTKDDAYHQRADRIDTIYRWVADLLLDEIGHAHLVVIEGPSMAPIRGGASHDRSGLWWALYSAIGECGFGHAAVAPPSNRAKYATGKGNAGKDEVLLAVANRWPDWCRVTNNDEADALVLASMGMEHLGGPVVELPQSHRAALAGVHWPATPPTPAPTAGPHRGGAA